MRIHVFFIGIAICLSSCTTVDYQEPTSGPIARVRFVTDLGGQTTLYGYDDMNCSVNEKTLLHLVVNPDPLFGQAPASRKLGIPLWTYHDSEARELYIAADTQTNGLFLGQGRFAMTIYKCAAPFFFTFRENHDYEVKFIWGSKDCHVTISEFEENSNGFSRKEVAAFSNRFPKTSNCLNKIPASEREKASLE